MLVDTLPTASAVSRAARNLGSVEGGWVLGYHPVARMNPFQALLYGRAHASGFVPVGLNRRDDFDALKVAQSMGAGAVLHLHWTSDVLARTHSEAEAAAAASAFVAGLEALREEGIRLVWSVHNVLPHRCPFPEIESRMRSELADAVDVIHVMESETPHETSAHYELPADKIIEVPHPSYIGSYPSHIDRASARFELGYEPSDLVLGAVGSIQPYKGLSEFSDEVKHVMDQDPDIRALIGGLPGRDEESEQLLFELRQQPRIDLVDRRLSSVEVATLTVALDAAVLPYRASLNSGAALLALSFGVPIVAPLTGNFRHLVEQGLGVGYDRDDPQGLRQALNTVRSFLKDFDSQRALDYAENLSAPVVSEQFFARLRQRLDGDR